MGQSKAFAALLILFIAVLLVFAFLYLNGRSTDNYSQAFLQNHSERIENNKIFFSFRLENHEGIQMEYLYSVFFDGKKIFEKQVFIENDYFLETSEVINLEKIILEKQFDGKKKVMVEVSSPTRPVYLSLSFWVFDS